MSTVFSSAMLVSNLFQKMALSKPKIENLNRNSNIILFQKPNLLVLDALSKLIKVTSVYSRTIIL